MTTLLLLLLQQQQQDEQDSSKTTTTTTSSKATGGVLLVLSIVVLLFLPHVVSFFLTTTTRQRTTTTPVSVSVPRGDTNETEGITTSSSRNATTKVQYKAIPTLTEQSSTNTKQNEAMKNPLDLSPTQQTLFSPSSQDAIVSKNTTTTDESNVNTNNTHNNTTTSKWRCACEGGFLPPGMLQSLGGAEAVIRMSTGQCYHKRN